LEGFISVKDYNFLHKKLIYLIFHSLNNLNKKIRRALNRNQNLHL
jgi:hypothetical protein